MQKKCRMVGAVHIVRENLVWTYEGE